MPPRGSPTRTSSWRRKSRTWSIGSQANLAARSRGRPKRINASPTSNMTPDRRARSSVARSEMDMGQAWIDGSPVALEAAIEEAARLLGASRLPVIAGLGADVAGTRAALALAQRLGGVVDHMQSTAVLRDLRCCTRSRHHGHDAERGPPAGRCPLAGWRGHSRRVAGTVRPSLRVPEHGEATRAPHRLALSADATVRSLRVERAHGIDRRASPPSLPALLAALRARIAGRPTGKVGVAAKQTRCAGNRAQGGAIWRRGLVGGGARSRSRSKCCAASSRT